MKHRLPFAKLVKCNLVEENEAPLPAQKGSFSFDIRPFQICTFRMK